MQLAGTPSDQLPDVIGTGTANVGFAFISMSGREPEGRDAEYLEWHSLDHRPEQHRLPGLRQSLRLVSTPECRAARAASTDLYDAADHVMTYLFDSYEAIPGFNVLGGALHEGGRMPLRLPSVGFLTADHVGALANPAAVAGADVIPWRPSLGVYLIIERGEAPVGDLVDVPGVAGVWWYRGSVAPEPYSTDARGLHVTYCYLDQDPVAVAEQLGQTVRRRWDSGEVEGLLAAPFYTLVPFEWTRHLPGGTAPA